MSSLAVGVILLTRRVERHPCRCAALSRASRVQRRGAGRVVAVPTVDGDADHGWTDPRGVRLVSEPPSSPSPRRARHGRPSPPQSTGGWAVPSVFEKTSVVAKSFRRPSTMDAVKRSFQRCCVDASRRLLKSRRPPSATGGGLGDGLWQPEGTMYGWGSRAAFCRHRRFPHPSWRGRSAAMPQPGREPDLWMGGRLPGRVGPPAGAQRAAFSAIQRWGLPDSN
jgi:hypothetical protein